jgi:hypothetical protein
MSCNSSTYQFVTKSLRVTRHRLLTSRAKTLCGTHGLQPIRDFFPNSEVLLACGCRRTCHNRKPEDIAAFEAARREHEARKQVAGKNHVNANGYCVTFVEDVEEIAA